MAETDQNAGDLQGPKVTGEPVAVQGVSAADLTAEASSSAGGLQNNAAVDDGPKTNGNGGQDRKVSDVNMTRINREFQEKAILKKAYDLGMTYIDLGKTPLNPDFLKVISIEDSRAGKIIAFLKLGKKLRVATVDPEDSKTKEIIEKLKLEGYEVDISLASEAGVDDALSLYLAQQKYKEKKIVKTVEEKAIATYEKEIANLGDLAKKLDMVTAEEGLNMLNIGAMKTNASDVHYEPSENTVEVRFRIDGILHKVFDIKPETYRNIENQIKYESKMQLNVTTVPQDGRYTFTFNENKIGVRVSSIPTPFGESFVCRFLVGGQKNISFEVLGFQNLALTKLQNACKIAQGMILITGPTGSGKSTTLYSILNQMSTPENKVITLEDPVEYPIQGVTQSQIDEKRGFTFASGLRAVLRQDPDIVMIGEVRDLDTAETCAQAALTGHVLLSTLHTNSALESIPRLINMGLPAFMVAPSLDTIVAQRLVRKICSSCGTKEVTSESERKGFESVMENLKKVNPGAAVEIPAQIPKVHGCDKCSNTGYSGRLVLAEVVTVNAEIKDLILNDGSMVNLISAARKEGMITMREDGFLKVAQGLTTLEEVYRVTNIVN